MAGLKGFGVNRLIAWIVETKTTERLDPRTVRGRRMCGADVPASGIPAAGPQYLHDLQRELKPLSDRVARHDQQIQAIAAWCRG